MSRGGKRENAGRKPVDGIKRKTTISCRLSEEAKELYDILCDVYGFSHGQMLEYMVRMEYKRLHNAE